MVLLDWKELGPQSAVKGWRGRPEEKRFVIEIKQSLCPELVEAKSLEVGLGIFPLWSWLFVFIGLCVSVSSGHK